MRTQLSAQHSSSLHSTDGTLSCLQISAGSTASSTLEFTRHIMRTEGWWRGLHQPGLLINCAAVATSQGIRLGLYPSVREALSAEPVSDSRPPLPSVMLASGLVSGSLGYFVAAPLFLLKVRKRSDQNVHFRRTTYARATQLAAQSRVRAMYHRRALSVSAPSRLLTCLGHSRLAKVRTQAATQLAVQGEASTRLAPPLHLCGYWLGSSTLVLRGALLTAGQIAGYDGTKWLSRRRRWMRDGPLLHTIAACVAGVSAASCSAPADVLQTRLQSRAGGDALRCAAEILRESGWLGFFRGWGLSVARLCPTFIIGSTVYEQTRRLMGLGYLR